MASKITAIVLASQRKNVINPLAVRFGVSHKCLIDLVGRPMILYVLETLIASDHIGRILVSMEDPGYFEAFPDVTALMQENNIEVIPIQDNMATSVFAAADHIGEEGMPMLITTADNALLLPEYLDALVDGIEKNKLDGAIGMTPQVNLAEKFPEYAARPTACYKFKDGGMANCNLYYLGDMNSVKAAESFKSGGGFKGSARRFIEAFGLINLIKYRFGWLSTEVVGTQMSKMFGGRFALVPIPFADAAVDVDNDLSYDMVSKVLRERAAQAG